MSDTSQQRPPQVTIAAGMVMVGSVLVVLSVWERLGTLRSLETREAIVQGLQDPPFSGLGLDVEGVIAIMHTASMVTAGCAAAMAILGWHVLQRNLPARLALTILAVPLFVSGLAAGGFLSSLVAAAVVILWMQPAREWYATGRWSPPRPAPAAAATTSAAVPAASSTTAPPPANSAVLPDASHASRPSDLARVQARPGAVVVAAVLTFVFAGLTALLALMSVLLVVLSPELIMTELERQRPDLLDEGITQSMLVTSTVITGSITVVWSVVALVLAGFALAGREGARRGLIVCAAAAAVALLAASLGAVFPLVPAIAAVFTVLQLRRPDVRMWFSQGRGRGEMAP